MVRVKSIEEKYAREEIKSVFFRDKSSKGNVLILGLVALLVVIAMVLSKAERPLAGNTGAVSYTHLTLPTIYSV